MSGIKEIAAKTGVCIRTVSQVLNGKYKGRTDKSRKIMKLIRKEAAKINYRPDNSARAMRTRNTGLVGIVIEEGGLKIHPVFNEIIQGANEILRNAGYVLTISSLTGLEMNSLKTRIFRENLLDGMLILDSSKSESLVKIRKEMPRSVMVNCNTLFPDCCVRRDELEAGRFAGLKLRELEFKRIFYLEPNYDDSREMHHYSLFDRKKGVFEGFSGDGLEIRVVKIGTGDMLDWIKSERKLITVNSAIVTSRNLELFCLESALSQLDLKAGFDFGLASLDDETGLGISFPGLSRVSFPRIQIGRIAAQMLIDKIAGNVDKCSSLEVKGEWIPGNTARRREAK